MPNITKKEVAYKVSMKTGVPHKEAQQVIESFLETIIEELGAGNRLEFRDFGVWEIRERNGRTAHNPKTLEKVEVPPKKTVKFKVGRLMKEAMKNEQTKKI